jgi:N-acetylmuramoyl-L-alanine amidase
MLGPSTGTGLGEGAGALTTKRRTVGPRLRVVALVLAVSLGACGGEDGPAAPAPTDPATAPTSTTAAPADPSTTSPATMAPPGSATMAPPGSATTVPASAPAGTAASSPSSVPASVPASERPLAGRTIALDPGHNGRNSAHLDEINRLVDIGTGTKACNTTGTATDDGYPEASFTWAVATRTREVLEDLGAVVVLTRDDNDGWGPCIDERAAVANRAGADAAVSIHADGGPADQRGFHVIHPLPIPGLTADIAAPSRRLAVALRDAYRRTGVPTASYTGTDGLSERGDLGGLNLSDVPVVFLEAGNMRHRDDAALLVDPSFQAEVAEAIATALVAFLANRG